jgi:Tfp pilus assembly protein FimT
MKQGGYREADIPVACAAEHRSGFTIVEVMIVFAVTSVMFIVAAAFISGRQNRTQFTTAINGLQQQIQQVINETANGFYPNSGTFTCVPSSTGPVTFTASANKQGTNGGCIFLGKTLQFGTASSGVGSNTLSVLPLVGNQYQASTTTPILKVSQASPRAIYPASASETTVPKVYTTSLMQDDLVIAASNSFCGGGLGGMCYVDNSTSTKTITGIAAFVAGDSSGNINALDGGGNLQAGSQQLSLYGVLTSIPNETEAAASTAIGGPSPYVSNLKPASSVSICIASPSVKQSGLFTIDSGLHVSLVVKAGLTC